MASESVRQGTSLHSIWKYMSDALVVAEMNGKIIDANPAFQQLIKEIPSQEIKGNIFEFYSQSDLQTIQSFINHPSNQASESLTIQALLEIKVNQAISFETVISVGVVADNQKHLIILIRLPQKSNPDSSHLNVNSNFSKEVYAPINLVKRGTEDLAERLLEIQDKEALNERILNAILLNFPNGTINVIDRQFRLVYSEGEEYKSLGLDSKAFVGLKITDIFPERLANFMIENYCKSFQGEKFEMEFENLGKYYQKIGVPLMDSHQSIHHILTVTQNITARKESEKLQKIQHEQLEAILNLSPSVTFQLGLKNGKFSDFSRLNGEEAFISDNEGFLFISKNSKDVFGLSPEIIINSPSRFRNLFEESEWKKFIEKCFESSREKKPFFLEFQITKNDGKKRCIQTQAIPTENSNLEFAVFNGVFIDITESKIADAQLRESEALTKSLIESSSDGVIAFDKNMIVTILNPVYEKRNQNWGYKVRPGMPLLNMIDPIYHQGVTESCKEVLSGKSFIKEIWFNDPVTNEKKTYENSYNPILNQNQEIIGAFIISKDISERKNSEVDLLNTKRQLESQRNFFSSVLDNSADAIFVTDRQGKFLYINQPGNLLSNELGSHPVLGKSYHENTFFEPEYDYYESCRERSLSGEVFTVEVIIKTNRKEGWYSITFYPVYNEIEEIIGSAAAIRNISERKKAEEELREKNEIIRQILDLSPNLIYTQNIATHAILFENLEFLNFFGKSQISSLGKLEDKIADLIHPLDYEIARPTEAYWQKVSNEDVFQADFRMKNAMGEWRWLRVRERVFKRDNQGRVTEIIGTAQDVTIQKQSKDRIQKFLSALPTGVIVVDKAGRFEFANSAASEILNWSQMPPQNAEDLSPFNHPFIANSNDIYPPENTPLNRAILGEGKRCDNLEILVRGSKIPLEVVSAPIFGEDNQLEYALAVFQDITERKKSEKKLVESLRIADISTIDFNFLDKTILLSERCFEQLGSSSIKLGGSIFPRERIVTIMNVHPEDAVQLESYFERATSLIEFGSNFNEPFEFRIRKEPHGEIRNLYVLKIEVNRNSVGKAIGATATIQDISQRKKLEEELRILNASLEKRVIDRTLELRNSQRLYEAIAKNFPSGIIGVYDQELTLLFTEGMEYRRVGILPEALIGLKVHQIYPPHLHNNIIPNLELAFGGIETRFMVDFGNDQYNYIAAPIFDHDGKISRIMVVVQNVTEQKRAEIKLLRSEAMLAEAQALASIGSFEFDILTGKVVWSDELYRIFERPKHNGELSFEEYLNFIHVEDLERVKSLHHRIVSHGEDFEAEYRIQLANGKLKYVRAVSSVARNSGNQVLKINQVIIDITTQKEADRILRENEERYRMVLEQTEQLIYDLDVKTGVNKWAGAIEKVTGYNKDDYSLSVEEWAEEIHPDDRDEVVKDLNETMKSGKPFSVDYRYRRKNGEYIWVRDSGVYLKNESGEVVRMLGAMKDISGEKKAAAEKEQMIEKVLASQKLEAIGTLSSGIAHEFNNLLSIVSLANESISFKIGDSEAKEQLSIIRKTVERGASIARQLLDFSRTSSDREERKAVNLTAVIAEVATTLRQLLNKKISIQTEFPDEDLLVEADDKKLYQVFLNLGINAGDAMPEGGMLSFKMTILDELGSVPRGSQKKWIRIEVSDSGTGIPQEIVSRIFEPFFTTKGVGKGTGLGLAIVHGFIQAHGGSVDVKSTVGKGTNFIITLPLLESADTQITSNNESRYDFHQSRILIVDDEPYIRKSLSLLLKRFNMIVMEAKDGKEALKVIKDSKKEFDLIISDLGMPNIDGLQLYQKLNKIKSDPRMIIMTGYLDSDRAADIEQLDLPIIKKPFELQSVLKEILNELSKKALPAASKKKSVQNAKSNSRKKSIARPKRASEKKK